MKNAAKYIGVIAGILAVTGILLWGINKWVEIKIQSKLDGLVEEGRFSYESLSVNLYTRQFSIRMPRWTGYKNNAKTNDIKAHQVNISNISYYQFLFKGILQIENIDVINPEADFYPPQPDTILSNQSQEKKKEFKNIFIGNLNLENGALQYFKQDTIQQTLYCQVPQLRLNQIKIDSNTIRQSIPFHYDNYSIESDSLYFRMNDLYDLAIKKFSATEGQLSLDSLQIIPRYGKYEFQAHIPYQKARVDLCIPRTEFSNTNWILDRDSIEFSASRIALTGADLSLYKDNRLKDYPFTKPLYSKMIRDLPIKIDVDSIFVIDGALTFQLRAKKEPPPGIVYFQNINGTIANVTNVDMGRVDFPKTTISADARFMKESNIHFDWSFNINNKADDFKISGNLSRISEQGINYFLTPALNVSAEGAINQLAFNFAGNNTFATGDVFINYDALRIHLLKKDGSKRRRWISSILNFLLRNKLNGPVEKRDVKVERVQNKSFWNFLWEMVKEGTVKSII